MVKKASKPAAAEPPDDEDAAAGGSGAAGTLDVDFEFCDPDEDDFHAVKGLLLGGALGFITDLNMSQLADSVVGQGNIGAVIKSSGSEDGDDDDEEDDDTSCGLMTVLNLRQFEQLEWPKTVRKVLLDKAGEHKGSLSDLFAKQGKGVEMGLLLSERFANLPFELIPPLLKVIKEDIEWSCSTAECPPDERPFYGFTHFVGVARCFGTAPGAATSSADGGAAPTGKRKRQAPPSGLTFAQEEVSHFIRRAAFSYTFPVGAQPTKKRAKREAGTQEGPEHRAVFVVTRKAFEQVLADVAAELRNAQNAAQSSRA